MARDYWLRCVLADRDLSQRAKVVANALYFYFNCEEFAKDGGLWAWPSIRSLDKQTGQSKNTVKAALGDLEAAGYLKPNRRYDPQRRRYKSHLYEALTPLKVHKLTHPRPDASPRVGQTGGTDSMNENRAPGSLASPPLGGALRSPGEGSKGEFEGEHALR